MGDEVYLLSSQTEFAADIAAMGADGLHGDILQASYLLAANASADEAAHADFRRREAFASLGEFVDEGRSDLLKASLDL